MNWIKRLFGPGENWPAAADRFSDHQKKVKEAQKKQYNFEPLEVVMREWIKK